MRKLFIAFVSAFLIVPAIAFAQEGQANLLKAFNANLSPSAEVINYTVSYNYQASGNGWWTGLVIMNGATPNNHITVSMFDLNGKVVGQGTFYINTALALRVGMLSDLIVSGYVPAQGSVFISGSNYFSVSLIVGNEDGGISVIEKTASAF